MSVDVVDRHRVLERDAGTSHAACMRLYTSTSTLARNADDLFMIYVLETCIKPTIGPEREWRTRFNGGHIGTAVQELIRCSMYLHLRKDLELATFVSPPPKDYYDQLRGAALVLIGAASSLPFSARIGMPYARFDNQSQLDATEELRRVILNVVTRHAQSARVKSGASLAQEDIAREELSLLTRTVVKACLKVEGFMNDEGREHVRSALKRPLDSYHSVNAHPELEFEFLYWRNHLFLAIFHQPWVR